jgi:hypothetical protein
MVRLIKVEQKCLFRQGAARLGGLHCLSFSISSLHPSQVRHSEEFRYITQKKFELDHNAVEPWDSSVRFSGFWPRAR